MGSFPQLTDLLKVPAAVFRSASAWFTGGTPRRQTSGSGSRRLTPSQTQADTERYLDVAEVLGGKDLYYALGTLEDRPKFILASGYSERDFRGAADLPDKIPFLNKPYLIAELASRVRQVLDEPPRRGVLGRLNG